MKKQSILYIQVLIMIALSVSMLSISAMAIGNNSPSDYGGKMKASVGDTATYEMKAYYFNNMTSTPKPIKDFYKNGTSIAYNVTQGMKMTYKVVNVTTTKLGYARIWFQRTLFLPSIGTIQLRDSMESKLFWSFPSGTAAGEYYSNTTNEYWTFNVTKNIVNLVYEYPNYYVMEQSYNWKTGWETKEYTKVLHESLWDYELISYHTAGSSGLPGLTVAPVLLSLLVMATILPVLRRKNRKM